LSFGRIKMVPFKTFPFLPPSEWIKAFFKQEQFLSLIKDRPEPSSTDCPVISVGFRQFEKRGLEEQVAR